ncbi:hypothetical protein LCGC14_0225620 [marine sediment metagenome]|uniref:Uncharacterized protein n=1 Tax=marine sediment metagenome TaxID=412755 RepID=A0A0F9UG19_9ZZZZ
MSRSQPENRLKVHWDLKGKRLELSADGTLGVTAVCLAIVVIGIALARLL